MSRSAVRRRFNRPWDILDTRRQRSLWRRLTAPQLFAGSFLALIAVGTLGLKFLPGIYTAEPLGWLDALFTTTSAVCVTGLITVDTATYFTTWGQAWILLLIQLGGLGIITFTTVLTLLLGQKLSLRGETLSSTSADVAPHIDYKRLTRDVLVFTFVIESVGAILLFAIWLPQYDWGWKQTAWHAIFHSISAFCNAGFSTFSDNLMGFQRSSLTLLVISGLIVIGGIGFLVLEEFWTWWRTERRIRRLGIRFSLHTRLVVALTLILIVLGWICFLTLEWNHTLSDLPFGLKAVNSLFMSVTPRTAGFNNIDYASADVGTNFLTIMLMGIGGSPGSTAGGLKTTTVALIVLLAYSRFRGREIVTVGWRTIPEETIQRAVGLAVAVSGLMVLSVLVMTVSEQIGRLPSGNDEEFLMYVFECTSAFNTVGLSIGITSQLSVVGKILMILLMFLGRVGPATVASALSLPERTSDRQFRYAYGDVIVG